MVDLIVVFFIIWVSGDFDFVDIFGLVYVVVDGDLVIVWIVL